MRQKKEPATAQANGKVQIEVGEAQEVRSDSYLSIYTNSVKILVSKWDVRILFSEMEPVIGDIKQARVVVKASTVMSHAHFNKMLEAMNELWDKNKGQIPNL